MKKTTISVCLRTFFQISLIALFGFTAQAQTTVPGVITTNQDWTQSSSPYIINQNTYTDTGIRIRVHPGVVIQSSSSSYTLNIKCEFQAIGKWDTAIEINSIHLNFMPESRGYNPANGRGASFKYCKFDGGTNLTTQLTLNSKSVKIDACEFRRSYFTVYMMRSTTTDTTFTTITNSKFYGDGKGHGSPIRSNIWISRMLVENCEFMDADYIYTYGNITFRNNTLKRMYSFSSEYLFGYNDISCNRFSTFRSEITLDLSGIYTTGILDFKYNTLDSIGYVSYPYKMLNIRRPNSNYTQFGKVFIQYNNFLQKIGGGPKLSLTAVNQNPFKTDSVDCTDNYWGSSDTNVIKGFISDYADDAGVYGRAIYSPYSSSPITGCSYNDNCATPDFNFTVTDNVVDFEDLSVSSKPYSVKWSFGDGESDTTNSSLVQHAYQNAGNYYACLYTYDSLGNLCDSLCKLVSIVNYYPCRAEYYFAVDTFEPNMVYVVNNSKGLTKNTIYQWTFGDGGSSAMAKPVHAYAAAGDYEICLNIAETSIKCNSTHCDSFGVKAGNTLLVLHESDLTSIKKQNRLKGVEIYPNPVTTSYTVSVFSATEREVKIELCTIDGKVLSNENCTMQAGTDQRTFSTEDLANGMYTVRIYTEGYVRTIQLVVNK